MLYIHLGRTERTPKTSSTQSHCQSGMLTAELFISEACMCKSRHTQSHCKSTDSRTQTAKHACANLQTVAHTVASSALFLRACARGGDAELIQMESHSHLAGIRFRCSAVGTGSPCFPREYLLICGPEHGRQAVTLVLGNDRVKAPKCDKRGEWTKLYAKGLRLRRSQDLQIMIARASPFLVRALVRSFRWSLIALH